jgi:hypothetical protein
MASGRTTHLFLLIPDNQRSPGGDTRNVDHRYRTISNTFPVAGTQVIERLVEFTVFARNRGGGEVQNRLAS